MCVYTITEFMTLINDKQLLSLVPHEDGKLYPVVSALVKGFNDYVYDISIITTCEEVAIRITKFLYKDNAVVIIDGTFWAYSTDTANLKQDIMCKFRSLFGLQPVLNDSCEFLYRDKHFLVDTCKNNPQICVVFDADDDYKPVLSVELEPNDELAPGKEVPDYILRLMY